LVAAGIKNVQTANRLKGKKLYYSSTIFKITFTYKALSGSRISYFTYIPADIRPRGSLENEIFFLILLSATPPSSLQLLMCGVVCWSEREWHSRCEM